MNGPVGTTPRGEGVTSYDAEIIWTTHGVPHITAADWGGLGFGQGYACARDRLPTIADHILKVRGERSRFLGAGFADRHLNTDLGYRVLGIEGRAAAMAEAQSDRVRAMVAGYAAGYNEALSEFGTSHLPQWCVDAPWIRPISEDDLYRLYVDLCLMASGRNLVEYLGSATAPDSPGGPATPPEPPSDGEVVGESHLGSNGWALGAAATGGPGMVMANPHFPWYGEGKLWECHLRIPGEIDVYGAALVGSPGVQIGFNQTLGFTHTFSRGHRFTAYRLDLHPDDPCSYRFGDTYLQMTSLEHAVEVRDDDGALRRVERTLWSTHHGPMVNVPFVGWSTATGFAYRDANIANTRFMEQVLALDTATDVPSLKAAFVRHGGLPWVNTMAADAWGRSWYIDSSATPALSDTAARRFVDSLSTDPIAALMHGLRIAVLDGSEPDNDWVDGGGDGDAGLLEVDALPQVERDDWVMNANDPYWLVNPSAVMAEHSPLCGLYRRPVTARTRMNLRLLSGEGPVVGSGPDGKIRLEDLAAMVLSGHSLTAVDLRDPVVARLRACGDEEALVVADVLAAWDCTYSVDARGAVLWREFMAGFPEEAHKDAGSLWAEAFDPDRPLSTPCGLAPAPGSGSDPVAAAAAAALAALDEAGIAPDARLGDVQWVQRGARRVEIPGGGSVDGVTDITTPVVDLARNDLDPTPDQPDPVVSRFARTGLSVGGYPCTYGVSWVMGVELVADRDPRGHGLLVYGQSDLPASGHHDDQVEDFTARRLRPLAFTDDAIAASAIDQRRVGTRP